MASETATRRWPPAVRETSRRPRSIHRLRDDSLAPIATAKSFGERRLSVWSIGDSALDFVERERRKPPRRTEVSDQPRQNERFERKSEEDSHSGPKFQYDLDVLNVLAFSLGNTRLPPHGTAVKGLVPDTAVLFSFVQIGVHWAASLIPRSRGWSGFLARRPFRSGWRVRDGTGESWNGDPTRCRDRLLSRLKPVDFLMGILAVDRRGSDGALRAEVRLCPVGQ